MEATFHIERVTDLPEQPDPQVVYWLLPKDFSQAFYDERVSRNIGWVHPDEQKILHASKVAIFGQGGMGGLIAATLVRLGVGTVIIVEPPHECFDGSNINRQFAAVQKTIGIQKAYASARMIREITDDTTLVVCPHEISENNPEAFINLLQGCDVILDEIEFWSLGGRLSLHSIAEKVGAPILNCNTVGHRTYLWKFSPEGVSLSECLQMSPGDAWTLQKRIQKGLASPHEIDHVMKKVMQVFLPEIPEYSAHPDGWSTVRNWHDRLRNEQKAIVISTNPPMASGFAANHTLFQILSKKSPIKRNFLLPPSMPGYLMFDAAFMESRIVKTSWW